MPFARSANILAVGLCAIMVLSHYGVATVQSGSPARSAAVHAAVTAAAVTALSLRSHRFGLAQRQALGRHRDLVEHATVIIWEYDPQVRQFTYVSPAAASLGYPLADWLRPDFWQDHIVAEDRDSAIAFCTAQVAYDHAHQFRYRMIAADGRHVWIEDCVSRPDRSGDHVLLRGVMVDVTARVIAEEQLRHAQSQAAAASQSKSEFLANMSHEIRTPMTAILGYTELLADDGDRTVAPPRRLEHIDTIRRNGEHLLAIINDILDVSKIEAGKLVVEALPTRLDHTIHDVLSLMSIKARAKGLALHATFETPIPAAIHTDPVRLRQILTNLIGNAIKFTDAGSVSVQVSAHAQAARKIEIAVRDSGIGMTPEQQSRLFAAFTQADPSITRMFGGSGLGLHISQRLAQLLGGAITVTSKPGDGSTFTLTIGTGDTSEIELIEPGELRVVSDSESIESESPSPLTMTATDQTLAGVRILLVEDGPDNQRLIAFHLRKAGAHVITADNGRRGIEQLTENATLDGALLEPLPVDLILTDMQMPELDGYEATRILRSRGVTLPIVALTAHAMNGDADRCLEAGCDEYATKPIKRETLIDVCVRAARRGGVLQSA